MSAPAATRVDPTHEQGFQLGEVRVEPATGVVAGPGGREQLDPKVMSVLALLARNRGHVVSREDMLAQLWPGQVVTDDAVSRCVYELRRHLTHAGGDERYREFIETLPKRGYRLNAETPQLETTPVARSGSRSRLPLLAMAVAAIVVAAVATWIVIDRRPDDIANTSPRSSAATTNASIAVLRFTDMSAGQDQGYLADGIAEEILNRLTQSSDLRVISRTSSFSFRNQDVDVPAIAARLNVTHVLEGSVRRSKDHVRITAQLIEASGNSHVWSETYDRELGDVFTVQDDIAESVASALNATLAAVPIRGRAPSNAEAYENYLQGKYFYERRSAGDFPRAVQYFGNAVSLDPGYATAWAALSGAYSFMAELDAPAANEWRAKQKEAAHRAVELDPMLAVAHGRMAQYYYETSDFERGDEHHRRASELDQDDLLVIGAAASDAISEGDLDRAIALQRRAISRDPLSPIQRQNLAAFLLADGQFDEALSEYREYVELHPDGDVAARIETVRIPAIQGHYAVAEAALARIPEGEYRDYGLALLHDAPGRRDEADAALARLVAHPGDYLGVLRLAEVYAHRGSIDAAFATLQEESEMLEHENGKLPYLYVLQREMFLSPMLTSLHDDPRWAKLLAERTPLDVTRKGR